MKLNPLLAIVAASLLASLRAPAATAADAAAPPSALSPQLDAALRQLSSDSFEEREKAMAAAQKALADQVRQMLAKTDSEELARIRALMDFNDALLKWAIDTLKLPEADRAGQLKWGLQPEIFPILAKIYSATPQTRIAGIKELGKLPGSEPSFILASLIAEEQRPIYLAAMEAVWDRPAAKPVVDALWNRAVEDVLAYRDVGGMLPPPEVQFRGKTLSAVFAGNYFSMTRIQDNALATDVLIQLKGAIVREKIATFLERVEKEPSGEPASPFTIPYLQPLKNVYRIIETCKYTETLPALQRLATAKVTNSISTTIDKAPAYYSNRTAALATALLLLKQDPANYKLQKLTGGGPWITGLAADEEEAVQKFQDFWDKHKDEYVSAPAIQPAAPPPAEPKPR